MTTPREVFTGAKSDIRVVVYQSDSDFNDPSSYYFACKTPGCGNCSGHFGNQEDAAWAAMYHAESHEEH